MIRSITEKWTKKVTEWYPRDGKKRRGRQKKMGRRFAQGLERNSNGQTNVEGTFIVGGRMYLINKKKLQTNLRKPLCPTYFTRFLHYSKVDWKRIPWTLSPQMYKNA